MPVTKELPTVTRLGKISRSPSYFIYSISTSLLLPLNAQASELEYQTVDSPIVIHGNRKRFVADNDWISENNVNMSTILSSVTGVVSQMPTSTVLTRLENKIKSKYQGEGLSFSTNQDSLLRIAGQMFQGSIDLTDLELKVLKKTFQKSIKYKPSLSGRK